MSVREEVKTLDDQRPLGSALAGLEYRLTRLLTIDGELLAYAAIFVLAVLTRFWDLGVRVMSHDESLHTRYAWNLYRGEGFSHTPLMHGPLLFHMAALSYLLFGDSDFTARIYPAVVGIVVVMMPFVMRRWLGKLGALAASFFFLISPLILYYSRYIRHDMPAILGALIMAVAIWRYIEERQFKYLLWLAFGQIVLFASKEVSFIYIAIYGSFITLFFLKRLLDAHWESRRWQTAFVLLLITILFLVVAVGVVRVVQKQAEEPAAEEGTADTITPLDPDALDTPAAAVRRPLFLRIGILESLLLGTVAGLAAVVVIGQWRNLRRFPELSAAVTMGTLILPMLTPFLIHFAGFDPLDSTQAGIARSAAFTAPMLVISVVAGLVYFARPPRPHRVRLAAPLTEEERQQLAGSYDAVTNTVEVPPDWTDWISAVFASRWWAIGGLFWLIFVFFFTTMFTNGSGLGTGIIGSLGYWLEQQGVKRGAQPWYYYIMVQVPIYEYLPLILSCVAGVIGLGRWLAPSGESAAPREPGSGEVADDAIPSQRAAFDFDAPIRFPVLLFIGYWVVANFVAYSIAGEKMPWLTTHLTTPMILLAGWVVGRLLERIQWRKLWRSSAWVLLALIPLLAVALLRSLAPLCTLWPANPLCNTVIPPRYIAGVLEGRSVVQLGATGVWIAAVVVSAAVLVGVVHHARQIGAGQLWRLVALFLVGWLTFLTARTAWTAAYINYDYPTEFLVYAHSAGSVKEVMDQIDEISLKTTDGYGLRVAYDNRVSWPMSWYLRNYYNAVYYADQPSRGLIGDAPVILAGTSNWPRVESLIGDRYYRFEYIRMWWPMQDYFGYEDPAQLVAMLRDVLRDPALQRGLWEIWFNRDYEAYADAVAPYRNGNRPNFELSQWPVPDRMRLYIRKDVFAQVWDYGVAASEIVEAADPYTANVRPLTPELTLGGGLLNRPHAVALSPNGLIYVADSNNHRIVALDEQGSLVQAFGVYGLAPAPDAFNEPWGVAVGRDGTVYVSDTWNHRVVAYDAQGNFVRTWGFEGPNQTDSSLAFWGPRGITVDQAGNVYVADTGNKRIMVFEPDGTFIRQIGAAGGMQGQLDEPVGVAVSNTGLLYVADTWNQRIQVFTLDGLYVREWPVEAWFAQSNERPFLTVDTSGNVYVTDPDASRVIVFDAEGEYLYSFGDYDTIGLAGGVVADGAGHVYVTDTERGTVQRYNVAQPGEQ